MDGLGDLEGVVLGEQLHGGFDVGVLEDLGGHLIEGPRGSSRCRWSRQLSSSGSASGIIPTFLHARGLNLILGPVFLRLCVCCASPDKPLLGLSQVTATVGLGC